MATLLHHIQPWMQKSITESEERLELRVLAWPTPTVDVSTLQVAVDSLRADIDTILEARVLESEVPSVEHAEDTVLATLFAPSKIPPPSPREHAKRLRV